MVSQPLCCHVAQPPWRMRGCCIAQAAACGVWRVAGGICGHLLLHLLLHFPSILLLVLPLPCLCSGLPLQESEYAAWVLVNGCALNHTTISGELQPALLAMLLL